MVILDYFIKNKLENILFDKNTFLLPNISIKLILGIIFFTINKKNK